MKKLLSYPLILLLFFCSMNVSAVSASDQTLSLTQNAVPSDLCQDMLINLLTPTVDKAIDGYYKKYFIHPPSFAPYDVKFIQADRPAGNRNYFRLVLEVMPYFGPHNYVGIDRISVRFTGADDIRIERFEHLKSFGLPQNYQNEVRSLWPPQ